MESLSEAATNLDVAIRKLRHLFPAGENPDIDIVVWLIVLASIELHARLN